MLSAKNVSGIINALVINGHSGLAAEFYSCCGHNWQGARKSLSVGASLAVAGCVTHKNRVDPRVAVRVLNALARDGCGDLVRAMCASSIGNLGRIAGWCSPDARAMIQASRQNRQPEPAPLPVMNQKGKFH